MAIIIQKEWIINFEGQSLIYIKDYNINWVFILYDNKDFNPYTSHLVNTEFECSSKLGPYCSFINN